MKPRTLALLALPLLTVASACRAKRAAPVAAPEAVAAARYDAAERARRDAAEAGRRAAEEARLRAEREAAERARAVLEAVVYFEYDRSDLDAEARQTLEAKLPVLQQNAGIRLRIAGHTDERGSDEYNLALSQRRAAAAKRFLTQRGIGDDRLDLVGFGEERPVCTDAAEACWSRNRRAAFELVGGTVAATAP
ncbi:OmpA family protein [Roseisolibacter sp. H3M3-2]|uniref:OmpA family protein n=1 Tax=Roseisolibacter sp. H3M3-2 TaxID=3031323 RepID=UPI0023DBE91B|nr:OmpA family protein [Roseisolibacter sp. H3M3-2]MDF1503058.1 OmpA family protein [Roseisolibacter sp. H3M3-2]